MLEEINATGGKRLTMSMEGLPAQKALDEETKSQRSAMSYKDQEASNQLLKHWKENNSKDEKIGSAGGTR